MAKNNDWLRLLGYVTGLVNQELLLRNEYLVAENRILKARIQGRLRLSEGEKATASKGLECLRCHCSQEPYACLEPARLTIGV
jgi:hypothetical protein